MKMNKRVMISTLWIIIMINMIFADILGFVVEFVKGGTIETPGGAGNVETVMLIAAIVTQIPIWMIFLSRFLKYKANRLANIVAPIVTIIYVVGGGEASPHYLFIAFVEVVCMLMIMRMAWKWKNDE